MSGKKDCLLKSEMPFFGKKYGLLKIEMPFWEKKWSFEIRVPSWKEGGNPDPGGGAALDYDSFRVKD